MLLRQATLMISSVTSSSYNNVLDYFLILSLPCYLHDAFWAAVWSLKTPGGSLIIANVSDWTGQCIAENSPIL